MGEREEQGQKHEITGQFQKSKITNFQMAANLAGLRIEIIDTGSELPGGIKVVEGYKGVRIIAESAEDVGKFWNKFNELEKLKL